MSETEKKDMQVEETVRVESAEEKADEQASLAAEETPMRWPCAVVQDLMPLEIDGLASQESGAAVRGHIEGCEGCRAAYIRMKKDVVDRPRVEAPKARSVMNGLWRRLSVRVATVAVVVALTAALLLNHLMNNTYWTISADRVTFADAVLSEGSRHIACEVDGYVNPYRTYAWLMADEEVENGLALHIRWETNTDGRLKSILPWSEYRGVDSVMLVVLQDYARPEDEIVFEDNYGRKYGQDAVLSAVYYDESPVGTSDPARAKLLWRAAEKDHPLLTFEALHALLERSWGRPH